MVNTIDFTTTLAVEVCVECGMMFAIPVDYQRERRRDHRSFRCPSGHNQYYPDKSDVEKERERANALAAQVEAERQRRDDALKEAEYFRTQRDATQRRLSATQGVVTRHKKRIGAGRCPCCSHTFKDVKAHMQRQHPDWTPEKEVEATTK